jgi:hypothetical protein
MHLLCNLWALYLFGGVLEVLQGRWRLGLLLVWSVACGSLARLAWNPSVLSAGASGGIFGLIGALLAVVLLHRRDFPPALGKMYGKWLLTVLLLNAVFLIDPRIDGVAHAGGFLGGLAMGLVLCRSPVRVSWPPLWTWPALAAMVLGLCLFGRATIARISGPGPVIVESPDLRERTEALAEYSQRLDDFGRSLQRLREAYQESIIARPAERKLLAAKIRSDLVPAATDANVPAALRELAGRVHSMKYPLTDSLDALVRLRGVYCSAVVEAVAKDVSSAEMPVIHLGARVLDAQARAETEVKLAAIELLHEARSPR